MFGKNSQFQKGMDNDARRRNREDERLRLRKEERDERTAAKRRAFADRRRRMSSQNQNANNNNNNNNNNKNNSFNRMNSHNPNQNNQQSINGQKVQQMIKQLGHFVQGCFREQIQVQVECCTRIRKLLSIERDPPIDDVIRSGVVPRLVQFLHMNGKNANARLQFEAAWALTNIASGTASHTAEVMKKGAVQHFVNLMLSNHPDVAEQLCFIFCFFVCLFVLGVFESLLSCLFSVFVSIFAKEEQKRIIKGENEIKSNKIQSFSVCFFLVFFFLCEMSFDKDSNRAKEKTKLTFFFVL